MSLDNNCITAYKNGIADCDEDYQSAYYLELVKDYNFLKQKFKLQNYQVLPLQFFRLRPSNFPTIRLSQLARLYNKDSNMFSKVIKAKVPLSEQFGYVTSLRNLSSGRATVSMEFSHYEVVEPNLAKKILDKISGKTLV